MKFKMDSMKKVLQAGAFLMFFCAAQAYAATITIDGYVDWYLGPDDLYYAGDEVVATTESPVTMTLEFTDFLIPRTGTYELQLRTDFGNLATLTIGDVTLSEPSAYSAAHMTNTPKAYFTDGVLTGFNWDVFDYTLGGHSSSSWVATITGDYFELYDFGAGGAWFTGVLDLANAQYNNTSPVPVPGAVWLLGSGLLGLVGIRRKIK